MRAVFVALFFLTANLNVNLLYSEQNFLGKVGGKLGAAALLGVLVRDKMEK